MCCFCRIIWPRFTFQSYKISGTLYKLGELADDHSCIHYLANTKFNITAMKTILSFFCAISFLVSCKEKQATRHFEYTEHESRYTDANKIDSLVDDDITFEVTPTEISSLKQPLKLTIQNNSHEELSFWDGILVKQLISDSSGNIHNPTIDPAKNNRRHKIKPGKSIDLKLKLSTYYESLPDGEFVLLKNIRPSLSLGGAPLCKCFAKSNSFTIALTR